ncbi:competence protein ComEC [Mucilaginibacter oryzae]|uniref:Competence protein ComEC n=1 Tax=Mucilaginibacter oryzae TaxID=468058 RepID=A0A316HAQ4_9SPHI|nr:ComEC/Rec2 family competence protein [Mucilaginibacter oryzae]PWK78194.1 competence protein ComEC [Mucilaginibacter oryzae]
MIARHKGEVPVVILLLPFLLGIAAGINFSSARYLPVLSVSFSVLLLVFLSFNLLYKPFNVYKKPWAGGVMMHILLLLAGWIAVINHNELNKSNHFAKQHAKRLLVRINNEPQLKNGIVRLTATVLAADSEHRSLATTGTLLIAIKDSAALALNYGDELLIPGRFIPIDPPFNPAEFNYKQYLAHQNIYYQEFLYPGQYRRVNTATGNPFIAQALQLRRQMVARFKQHLHTPNAIAVASTLILGYKAELSDDVLQAYSKTGTIHVLSVSGAHVGLVWAILAFLLQFLNRFKYGRLIRACIIIPFIWYYAMLSGFSPAVCRAAAMISMVVIGKTYNRYVNNLNILAISAFVLLLYNPLYITDVGFQLSYLAVAGLIVLQPVVYKWLGFKRKWMDKLWQYCSVSIAAQVITFPLSAFYFHQFPVYFLFSNLFIVIPSAVIMGSGLALLALSWVPYLSSALAFVLEKTILIMNDVLGWIEHAPFAAITKIWLTTAEYLLLYAIIIFLFSYLYHKKKWLLRLTLVGTLLLAISTGVKRYRAYHTNTIAFLNLRKNMGIVFKKGNEAVVLSNLADTDKSFKYSVQPYLDSCKISHIEVYSPEKEIMLTWLHKNDGLIRFNDQTLAIIDKETAARDTGSKTNVSYLYITQNPEIFLDSVNKNYEYHTVIIDATNSPKTIQRLIAELAAKHINYIVLRRNKSYVVTSN